MDQSYYEKNVDSERERSELAKKIVSYLILYVRLADRIYY